MEPEWFWKNFRLGTELQVSGSFIYNGLFAFDQMKHIRYESECFDVLYNLAVGMERLSKITVALIEISKDKDLVKQKELEESLVTHSTRSLIDRVRSKYDLNLGNIHNDLIALLDEFYARTRYSRYSVVSVYKKSQDLYGLLDFVLRNYGNCVEDEYQRMPPVTRAMRERLGKTVIKITSQLYQCMYEECTRHVTFTYEIAYKTKAFKIFMAKQGDFSVERTLQREALLHVLNSGLGRPLSSILEQVKPLELEFSDTNTYLRSIFGYELGNPTEGEVEELYFNMEKVHDRRETLDVLGSDYNFDAWEEYETEELE